MKLDSVTKNILSCFVEISNELEIPVYVDTDRLYKDKNFPKVLNFAGKDFPYDHLQLTKIEGMWTIDLVNGMDLTVTPLTKPESSRTFYRGLGKALTIIKAFKRKGQV